ncbi:hypothetical protein EII17_07670 [Clostridiales bacterium COT073_COT-073]|nr:hypothetical protein EII17_07670 [Clostridiales bacterium COT073_COT-073]
MQIYEIVDEDSTIARCDREKTLGNSLAERFFTVNFRENHLGEIVNQSGHSVIVKESGVLFVWSLD